MPVKEVLVVVVCLVVGYLLVNALMSPGIKPRAASPNDTDGDANSRTGAGASADSEKNSQSTHDSKSNADLGLATLSTWYKILGVREKATREEIVAAYKKKVSQYHPDKVAQMGEEIRAVAEAKTKQINAAYELAMRIYR